MTAHQARCLAPHLLRNTVPYVHAVAAVSTAPQAACAACPRLSRPRQPHQAWSHAAMQVAAIHLRNARGVIEGTVGANVGIDFTEACRSSSHRPAPLTGPPQAAQTAAGSIRSAWTSCQSHSTHSARWATRSLPLREGNRQRYSWAARSSWARQRRRAATSCSPSQPCSYAGDCTGQGGLPRPQGHGQRL